MNLADVFTVTFLILGFILALTGYWLLAAGLFPQMVEGAAERVGRRPVAMFGLGLVTLLPLVIGGLKMVQLGSNGGLKLLGLLVMLVPLLGALFGSAGLALRVGRGLPSAQDGTSSWRPVWRGGLVLGVCIILPALGTFLILPYTLLAGFGAWVAGAWSRRPVLATEAPLAAPAS